MAAFSFLSNHGLVLLCIAHDPDVRMRDLAAHVGITERAAQRIVAELIEHDYVTRVRVGRRNRYTINEALSIALPNSRDIDIGSILNVLVPAGSVAAREERVRDAT